MARRSADERTRRRFARRQWARRWLTWRYVVALLVLLLAVGGGVYAVYFSSALSVQGVEVTGARTLSEAEVLEAADVPTGGPLATLDLVAIQRRVASLAVVRSVEVSRRWPDDVLIEIEEREPVAVVDRGGELRAVDAEGVVFGSYRKAPRGLPRIEPSGASGTSDTESLREAAAVAAALPDAVAVLVDHLEPRSADQIDLELRDGRLVRWGSAEASEQKGEVLLALLDQPGEVYDVSVPGAPTTSGSG